MTESDRDKEVAQAYRALGAEEPPRALDEAILAAARRRPARWRVPLSIAAVVMLAVGVTLRMLPHEPGAESVALAPQVMETPRPAAPPAETQATTTPGAAAVARAPERRAARNEPGTPPPVGALAMKDEAPAQVAGARARGEAQSASQAPAPAAAAPPALAADAARRDEAVAGAKAQAAERGPAAAAEQAAERSPAAAPRALAAAKLAEPATPEAWLERIAELKKQGRAREAEESLAEFRKRYPGYKIPEALTR